MHLLDAAKLVQLAIERAAPRTVLHAVAEDGIQTREIARAIGTFLTLPVTSIPAGSATEHFGWLGSFFGADAPASSVITRQLLDWEPKHPSLLADIAGGHYPGR